MRNELFKKAPCIVSPWLVASKHDVATALCFGGFGLVERDPGFNTIGCADGSWPMRKIW
jgi:hypothetical protein